MAAIFICKIKFALWTHHIMNLIQIIASNSSCSKHGKAQNLTLLFVNNLQESLDTIWHARWLPKKNGFMFFVFYTLIYH